MFRKLSFTWLRQTARGYRVEYLKNKTVTFVPYGSCRFLHYTSESNAGTAAVSSATKIN